MKRLIILLSFSSLLCIPIRGQEVITLAQCYEWAQQNYPLINQYGLIDQTEHYNLSNAAKNWLPQLAVSGKATYQSDVTKLPFDTEQLSALMPGFNIPTLSKDQYQITGEVSQNIWDGGTIRSTKDITRAQAVADREKLESDLYTLNERVNQLYFGALLQDELLRQNSLLQQEYQININRIDAMMANGVANLSDKESMEVELLNARQQEIEILASRQAYRTMLSALTGKRIDESTQLEIPYLPMKLSNRINRPELRAFDAQEQLVEVQNKQITAGLMPKFGMFFQGGYGRPGLNFLEDKFKPFYVTGVRLSWNMGNLYTLKNDRRKIEMNRQMVELQKETFLFNTNLQLLQQDTEIAKTTELIQSDQEIIRMRNSIKKAAEVKLENGVISVTDLIREINAEDLARQSAAIHKIQQLMAVYNYLYTTNNPE